VRSLRGRLTVWLLAGTGLFLVAGGLLLNRVISARLRQEFDAALITKARSLMTLTEQQGDRVWLEFADEIMPEFEAREKPDYFQLWLVHGAVIERSRSLGTRDLTRSGGPLDQVLLRDLTLPDGRRGREVEITFRPRAEQEEDLGIEQERASSPPAPVIAGIGGMATLAVAHGREDLDAFLSLLHTILTLGVMGLLAGIAFLVKTVVGIGLGPLDDLARRLETMDAASLGKALEVESAPVELVPVIHHLRGLLGRLDESFQRERAFSANLAHELRTPLAELRTLVEVALKWPGDSASCLDSLREARDIGFQMERVVVNLLALARCEGGQHAVRASEVALSELATSCWAVVAPQAEERGISFKQEIPEDLTTVTDGEKLSLILSNLFSNAVAHGSPGSLVTCSAEAEGGELALRVSNATDSLTPGDLPRMFDRFWRKDSARSDSRHAGLGLALVSALCELLQLRKQARLEEGLFEITLKGSLLIVPSSKAR
jgi:two-component system sensor histidine kinase QseC